MVNFISVLLFKFLGFIIRLLPLFIIRRIAYLFGIFLNYIMPVRKKVALYNLNICFPEKDYKWKKDIIKKSYINLAVILFEFFYIPRLNKKYLDIIIKFQNDKENLFNNSKSTFFLSAHFSNWEYLALASLILDKKFNIIAKIQGSKSINPLINEYREKFGNEIILMGSSLRKMFAKIINNEIICFLVDQSAHSDYSVYTKFFGKIVPSYAGPAKLALKYRPNLIFANLVRQKDYNYELKHYEIDYTNINGDNEENVINLTSLIQENVEKTIRQNPEQWVWFHKRFKHMKES